MSVEFDEEKAVLPIQHVSTRKKDLVAWVISLGFAKNTTQALYFLVGVVVVCVALTAFLLITSSGSEALTQEQIQEITNRQKMR